MTTTFAQLDLSLETGLPVYAVRFPDDRFGFDEANARLKINSTNFIHLNGPDIGNGGAEGQTREVKLIGYVRVSPQLIRV